MKELVKFYMFGQKRLSEAVMKKIFYFDELADLLVM